MKSLSKNIILIVILSIISIGIYAQNKYKLIVIVNGIEKISGKMEITLYNKLYTIILKVSPKIPVNIFQKLLL